MEFFCVDEIKGPVVVARGDFRAMYGEVIELNTPSGVVKAQVMDSSKKMAVLRTFERLEGVSSEAISARFTGELFQMAVSEELLGRRLDGSGRPTDGGPIILGERREIQGTPIRPSRREPPRGMVETGISSIDVLNSLVKGQKLPIFSGYGLSHLEMLGRLLKDSRIKNGELKVVFAGMGLTFGEYSFINNLLERTGAIQRSSVFLNKATDPVVERIVLPRLALTTAEFLAFDQGMDVLAVLYDLTNYAEALREVSSMQGELPGRMGYPPYLYTDLASLMERSGVVSGSDGSLTQIPILTMPNDDLTHPVPDLTGYITEGQLILSRELEKEGIFPPVDIIPSLSRLMHSGTKGLVREDHKFIGNLLYSSYSKYRRAKKLRLISGEEALSGEDKKYIEFGEALEGKFLDQEERRGFENSLDIAWEVASLLPDFELSKVPEEFRGLLK